MQDYPLTVSSIRRYGTEVFGDSEVGGGRTRRSMAGAAAGLGRRWKVLEETLRRMYADGGPEVILLSS